MNEVVQYQCNKKCIYQQPCPFNVHSCLRCSGHEKNTSENNFKNIFLFHTHNQIIIDLDLTYRNLIQNNRSIPCVNNKLRNNTYEQKVKKLHKSS